MADIQRPLSPHLQIWRWRLHMMLSIAHRTTGAINGVGALLVVAGLVAVATGPDAFYAFRGLVTSIVGQIVLFGFTASLMLHLCTGIRHLVMDTGRGLQIEANRRLGVAAVIAAVFLTVALWVAGYWAAGAF